MQRVVVIDGKWLAYRMHYSHLNLQSTDGTPTGIMHGFLLDLLKLHKTVPEARIIVCWDGKGITWRHRLYPAYKANREFNPEKKRMVDASELLLPILRGLGFKVLRVDGVEADDMIGMVATRLSHEGWEVRIYCKDQDLYQLVRGKEVTVWHDLDERPIDENEVKKRMGVMPGCVCDIRAMAGDSSDNLKGLPGVGIPTAIKLYRRGLTPDGREGPRDLIDKYKEHWPRIRKELRCAQLVVVPDSDCWSRSQQEDLRKSLERVVENPGRNRELAERNRAEIYRVFGRYELQTVLEERHRFFTIP